MAEKQWEVGKEGEETIADTEDNLVEQTLKRCSSGSPGFPAPPNKSPRIELSLPYTETQDIAEGNVDTEKQETNTDNMEGLCCPTVGPTERRKSWRRDTKSRRSLPALQNPHQILCRSIDPSLPQRERLQMLTEASLKLSIEKTQTSLQSVPNISLESFQKQVAYIQKECVYLAKDLQREPQDHLLPAKSASDPAVQVAMKKLKNAISRLQAESESWEALLNKHQRKAEELKRKVEMDQVNGTLLNSAFAPRSSQYLFIQNKPDYREVLCRQQPMFHSMALIMDLQCEMFSKLLSIEEESQILVKETSGRLAAEAGFQDLSPDIVKNLMTPALSSATT